MLNERGVKTKRGNNWSQNSVCRILTNEIYTGKIINGKEEIADFLTGQRKEKDESKWLVTIRPELRIIDDEIFDRAQSTEDTCRKYMGFEFTYKGMFFRLCRESLEEDDNEKNLSNDSKGKYELMRMHCKKSGYPVAEEFEIIGCYENI